MNLKVRDNEQLNDVTSRFSEACAVLQTGQLVKDEDFTLYECVAALEIMDPKMDSGFLAAGETLCNDYDVLEPPSAQEMVGIIDQMLCHEAAWHQGYPLSRTLFTSLHLEKLLWPEPKGQQDVQFFRNKRQEPVEPILHVLRSYCIGVIKCCDFVIKKLHTQDYYEEEDFVTHVYNRPLLPWFSEYDALQLLDESISWMHNNLRNKSAAPLRFHLPSLYRAEKEAVSKAFFALVERLEFRKDLLKAMAITPDPDLAPSAMSDAWGTVPKLLSSVQASHIHGVPLKQAFTSKIPYGLASTIPPKPVIDISFDEAVTTLMSMCKDSQDATLVLDIEANESPSNLLNFVWSFNSRRPEPLAYSRACLGSLLISEYTRPPFPVSMLLVNDLAESVLPEDEILDPMNQTIEITAHPKHLISNVVDSFLNRILKAYVDFWSALCQNRSRIRRNLTHVMLDFDKYQLEAEDYDLELVELTKEQTFSGELAVKSPSRLMPLRSWLYCYKLRQMEWVIQLGFELDIYLSDEVAGMYWVLQQILATRVEELKRIQYHIQLKHSRLLNENVLSDSEKGLNVQDTIEYLSALGNETSASGKLANGLSTMYTLLYYTGNVTPPTHRFNSSELRYQLRMKPFKKIRAGPEQISFDRYEAAIKPFGSRDSPTKAVPDIVEMLCKRGEMMVRQAKVAFAEYKKEDPRVVRCVGRDDLWKKGVEERIISCIAAGVSFASIRTAYAKKPECKLRIALPEPGKRYHDWWIVPKVTSID